MTTPPSVTAMFREAATRIGRRLCRDAVWDEDCCTWLTWRPPGSRVDASPVYRTCPADFFDGTSGIGLFLWYLGQVIHDPQVRRTSEGALRHADRGSGGVTTEPRSEAAPGIASGPDERALDELRNWLKVAEAGSLGHREVPEGAVLHLTESLRGDPHAMVLTSSMANGWCGICDALLWYQQHRQGDEVQRALVVVAASAYERSVAGIPWSCGGGIGVETPDLLHGLAGTGWCYLRLADPSSIPSPFALAEVRA